MAPRKPNSPSKPNLNPEPARRGPGRPAGDTPPTVPKSYTLPFPVVLEIRRAKKEYGSQGRVLQVGSELLSRLTKKPSVPVSDPDSLVRMTYKLVPRTIQLIDDLARTVYGDEGRAIAACVEALKRKKIE
jgi:hypothetical protein